MSEDIMWLEKSRSVVEDKELSIRPVNTKGKESKRLSLRFYNNAHKKITTTDYMAFGLTSNRLYFKEALTTTSAYKLHAVKDGCYVQVPNVPREFIGEYKELHLDAKHDLFYVEVDNGG